MRLHPRAVTTAFILVVLLSSLPALVSAQVVISQIYTPGGGGGGTQGWASSYIELHNNGTSPVVVDGWSLQYAQPAANWQVTPISGTIPVGGYYLVKEVNFNPLAPALPGFDAVGTSFMVPAAGKVALVSALTQAVGCAPTGVPVVDFVGWGASGCWEGSASAPAMGPTNANFRQLSGCSDTNDNLADFTLGVPVPRYSASPLHPCSAGPVGTVSASPSIIPWGGATTFMVVVQPGYNPASTGITVTADLSALGGSSAEAFYDDGTHGDVTAGDNIFILTTGALHGDAGLYSPDVTIADAQSRSQIIHGALEVVPPVVVSQVYTPGGSGGFANGYDHSYIELHNRGAQAASLTGWSVQYSAFSDTAYAMTPLSGSIPPGGYYLVREDNPAPSGQTLPTPDAIGTTWLFPAGGKVALIASQALAVNCAGALPVIDFVGYGATQCWEGSGSAPGNNPMNAHVRINQGCIDTNDNAADFVIALPAPHNSASPPVGCGLVAPAGLAGTSQPAVGPGFPIVLTDQVSQPSIAQTIGAAPARIASAFTVSADLSAFGLGVAAMRDDGQGGDATAGDNVYSYLLTVPQGTPAGSLSVPMTACNALALCSTVSATVNVANPTGVGDAPLAFALRGAAPNPSVGTFTMSFVLPTSEAARLSLLDVAGRRVASFDVGRLGAGAHAVRFGDAARLAPGVYLARLTQGARTATARVIVR